MKPSQMSLSQRYALIFLRIFIGWHFLYEGLLKVYNPGWTARGFLMSSQGPLENLFVWMAGDGIIGVVDFLNAYGLVAIGLGLVLGFMERPAALAGIILLFFYYLSHPPFMGLTQVGTEGSYWIVNKNLIEAVALLVIYYFPTARVFGLEQIFKRKEQTNITTE